MSSNKQNPSNLSREDIERYLLTDSEQEKYVLEKKALQTSFDSEALDGWSESTVSLSQMKQLDKRFKPTNPIKWIYVSAAVGLLISGIITLFIPSKDSVQQEAIQLTEKTDLILPDSIRLLQKIPNKEIITTQEIQISKKELSLQPEINQPETKDKELLIVSELPILKPDFSPKQSNITTISAKEIYLNGLKVIDYRAYRSKPLLIEGIRLTGIAADKESKVSEDEILEEKDLEITYHEYLSKTTNLLKQNEFKQALARLNTILKTYPDDINALFYSGLCYYNLGEFEKAIVQFKLSLSATYNNFMEESEWMLAKSYEAIGESEKAKAIYGIIKSKGGYYSKQVK